MSIPPTLSNGANRSRLRNPGFHARLKQLVGAERPYTWADRIGISKGAFTRIWKEGTVPTSELILRIRAATGVSLDWLLTGEGTAGSPAYRAADDLILVQMHKATGARRRSPQRASRHREDYVALRREWIVQRLRANPDDLAFVTVKEESMAPTLANGDLALVDCGARTVDEDGIYVFQQDASLRIRRVQRLDGNRFQALSDNPRYLPFTFRLTARFSIVGRVVWVGKRI
jgi:phage repressor protein C with HTH and peptisase S24 domain